MLCSFALRSDAETAGKVNLENGLLSSLLVGLLVQLSVQQRKPFGMLSTAPLVRRRSLGNEELFRTDLRSLLKRGDGFLSVVGASLQGALATCYKCPYSYACSKDSDSNAIRCQICLRSSTLAWTAEI